MITPKAKILDFVQEDFVIPEFDASLVSKEVIMEELKKHQVAYLEAIVSSKAELKFLEDSIAFINDLEENDKKTYEEVHKHWVKSQTDPNYFQKNRVEPKLHKPLGNLQNIQSKLIEVKKKLWAIEYHSKKINEVRGYLAKIK